jgi:hypothetical protein
VAKVGTSKADGTISQQASVHPWIAVDAHGNKQTTSPELMLLQMKRFTALDKAFGRYELSKL